MTVTSVAASFDDPDSLTKHMKAPALPTKPPRPPRPAIAVKAGDNLEPDNKKIKVAVSEGPVLWSGKVEESSDGQRLRYFIRQQSVQLSKKKAEQHIQNGCVLLNAEVLFDSSRILRYKDEVELRQFEISTANSVSPSVVDIVHQEADWVVGWKPVGIRTQGAFSEQTMESLVSKQLGGVYESLSKMDTGCGGLCVFWRKADDNVSSKPLVMHEYTALVHGYVEW
eukprot:CAMPEP_0178930812 /NCGR_PEP_ID=MMETSP0786-20121207/21502_1 /TAXON_ID=186022 /ORGANISM="Thalassionema frauenfeldii, Strain CCMP 1798" /LENGTH=224 /DNA_ID=CAMNT_0020607499 /DNA_START=776 /DNA_END=1446 /DNA_ORIENTATION=-